MAILEIVLTVGALGLLVWLLARALRVPSRTQHTPDEVAAFLALVTSTVPPPEPAQEPRPVTRHYPRVSEVHVDDVRDRSVYLNFRWVHFHEGASWFHHEGKPHACICGENYVDEDGVKQDAHNTPFARAVRRAVERLHGEVPRGGRGACRSTHAPPCSPRNPSDPRGSEPRRVLSQDRGEAMSRQYILRDGRRVSAFGRGFPRKVIDAIFTDRAGIEWICIRTGNGGRARSMSWLPVESIIKPITSDTLARLRAASPYRLPAARAAKETP